MKRTSNISRMVSKLAILKILHERLIRYWNEEVKDIIEVKAY